MRIMKVNNVKVAQGENIFTAELTPEIILPEQLMTKEMWADVDKVWPCSISYRIDVEYRSWGIKGISVSLDNTPISVTFNLSEDREVNGQSTTEMEVKQIKVDPSKIKLELTSGPSVSLSKFELNLNPDYTVDYNSSTIIGTTLM